MRPCAIQTDSFSTAQVTQQARHIQHNIHLLTHYLSSANLYIADWSNHRVRKVTASTSVISTIAGTGTITGSIGDGGAPTSAKINNPVGVAVDTSGKCSI